MSTEGYRNYLSDTESLLPCRGMPRICTFCPRPAVEKGGEHIWDDWLNRATPKTKYRAYKQTALNSLPIEYDSAQLSEKLPVVCEPCNSGWMSVLTNKVKQRFGGAILDGEPFTLGLSDAALLAGFTLMKAVVTNQSLSDDPFFTRAARERLRESLVLPPLVQCWFAAYERDGMQTISGSHVFSPNPGHKLYGLQFCSFNYVVGKLALQLLAPRWKNILHRGRNPIMVQAEEKWKPAASQFWPNAGAPISWPPPRYIGKESIKLFIERFGGTFMSLPI
jgi:hypothetical protein